MNMRIIAALLLIAAPVFADVIPTVQWDVETGRLVPVPYALSIRRGESVNLQPRFLSYNSAMNLAGAAIQFRYWYTGQTGYYAATGSLMAATGRVQVAWSDALCPASNSLNYEVRATLSTQVLARAYGTLRLLSGTSGTLTNGEVRTSINWALIDQLGGNAVLSNHMGSGATWTGTNWTFAGSNFATNAAFIATSNLAASAATDAALGVTNATGGILSLIGRQVSLVTSNLTAVLGGVYAAIVHDHTSTAITNAPWTVSNDVTNSLNLAIAPSLTGTVSKAASALQAEADTINTVLQRGSTITLGVESGIKISPLTDWLGSRSLVFLCPSNFPTANHAVPLHLFAQYYPYYPFGPSLFHGAVLTDVGGPGAEYMLYDSGNFLAGTHYLAPNGSGASLTGITPAQVNAVSNSPAGIAAAGGLTNRAYVSPTALDCAPTTTVTKAMIDAAPWGEMYLSLTGATYLTFDATVTGTTDAATFAIYLTGTNSLTWNTNQLTGTAWTNATATGSDRIFRKASGKATVAIW